MSVKPYIGICGERGSALIIVLGAIAVMTLLIVHIATWSEVTAKETKTDTDLSMFYYIAQSATARALWMHAADKRDYKSRTLLLPQNGQANDRERWMADSKAHKINVGGMSVHVAIKGAGGGFMITTPKELQELRTRLLQNELDFEQIQKVESFINTLLDYVDRGDGDAARLNGMERPEYKREGLDGLPRNGPMQFREELFWLPASVAMAQLIQKNVEPRQFLDFFQIPTDPSARIRRQSKPSFFSSSPAMLQYLAGLDQDELTEVLTNRQGYLAGNCELFDSLDAGLVARIKHHFSFEESGFVTIETRPVAEDRAIRQTHRVTRYASLSDKKLYHR